MGEKIMRPIPLTPFVKIIESFVILFLLIPLNLIE